MGPAEAYQQVALDYFETNYPCPTCERVFDSELGMKQHHKRVHDVSIAGVLVECDNCGSEVRKFPSNLGAGDHSFCDRDCLHQFHKGENHPRWVEYPTVECTWCGSEFQKQPSEVKAVPHHFCTDECENSWRSVYISGENHPRYVHGERVYYGRSWEPQREKALERDGHQCALCGFEQETHRRLFDRGLHVHHIIPFRVFGLEYHRVANDLENLITVCRSCHSAIEPISQRRADELGRYPFTNSAPPTAHG